VSGFDVVQELKADLRTRDIPILIVTAKEMTEADKSRLQGHVTDVLQKGSGLRVELLTWLAQQTRESDMWRLERRTEEVATESVGGAAG
jgi:CheY-like chemotaxis protein